MDEEYEKLKDIIVLLSKSSEKDLEDISNTIDDIIKYKIKNERTISEVFDLILNLEFVDEDKKEKCFINYQIIVGNLIKNWLMIMMKYLKKNYYVI